MKSMIRRFAAVSLFAASAALSPAHASGVLLNASYDVARDFYKDFNPKFAAAWRAKTGESLELRQSHGGSSKQVRAVADGLEADVVTMNQATDVQFLADKGLVAADWQKKFPNAASPFSSTMVFIVRKGNPKRIHDWPELARSGVQVILPHPKNTGNGRYSYLAAYGWALRQPGATDASARGYVSALLRNAPLFAAGGRDATTTFIQRRIGDVLITFESEADLIAREFGRGEFDIVYPSESIQADFPVAVVEKYADKHGTRKQASAYLQYLWSREGQSIAAQNYIRPRDPVVLKQYAAQFPPIRTFTVEQVFGGWSKAAATHFRDGGSFDQIFARH